MKFQKLGGSIHPVDSDAWDKMKELEENKPFDAKFGTTNAGSVNMLRTWRGWMNETAKFMSGQGVTMPFYIDSKGNHHGERPYDGNDAHAFFTSRYLGVDENGKRKTWSMAKKDPDCVQASIGDRLHAMNVHEEWCTQRGIKLTIPADSEYMKLNKEQNKSGENVKYHKVGEKHDTNQT